MERDAPDRLLGDALGLEYLCGRWVLRDRPGPGLHLRYVWRVMASDPVIIGGSVRLLVAGLDVSADPKAWRPCSPRWRAALGAWHADPPRVVTAEPDDDPAARAIGAVRWCHSSSFPRPPYGLPL